MVDAVEIKFSDFTDDMPDLSGLKIKNRYVLMEEIGHGLMARAYLAHDELLEGEVVVKVINTEIGGIEIPLGPEWTQEAKRAMKVRGCPYIASVTDFGEETCFIADMERKVPFIVWERVYGKTLQDYLDEKREIEEGMIISVLMQLLQVLIALKRGSVLHGDLHVKNVIYDNVTGSRHFIKVIDFGLANLVSSEGDFLRDQKGTSKIVGQILEVFREQDRDNEKASFTDEMQKIIDELSKPSNLTLEELNGLLMKSEELERKFFLGVEWFQSRSKNKPLGYESAKYLRTVNVSSDLPIVGIDEIDELFKWLKIGLDQDQGRILAIKGETGSGKSRFGMEILHKLSEYDKELFIMRTAVYRGDSNKPFEPVRRLWRSFLGEEETEHYKQFLSDMFPEIPLIIEPLANLLMPAREIASEKQQVLDETNYQKLISTGFKHLALKNGIVIFVDDVDFSDDQTVDLIRDISLASARYPIMLILTFGDGLAGKCKEVIDELSMKDNYLRYELSELTFAQTQALITNKYKWKSGEDAKKLTKIIHSQVGGNPLYVSELLKFFENRNYITRKDNEYEFVSEVDITENPKSVQAIMIERVNMLSSDHQLLVRWAAILGTEFHIEHLYEICTLSRTKAAEIMDNLASDLHMFAKSGDQYAFTPHLLYKVVYSSIPGKERVKMHSGAVDVLKAQVYHDPRLNAYIADHLIRSGRLDTEVAEHYLKAANHAFKSNLRSQANDWCNSGIDVLGKLDVSDEQLKGKFFLLKGVLSRQSGDGQGYRENTYCAYNCAVLSRDKHLEGRTLKALGEYYRSIADYPTSIDYYKNALVVMEELRDEREIALILKELSINYCFTGNFDEAIMSLSRSREICEELNDLEGMARIYNNMGLIYKILGETQQAKEWLERSITLFREIDDVQGEVLPIGNMAIIYTEEGEFERAMILLREIISSENRLTDTRITAKVHITLGDVLFELGEYKESMEYYEKALRVFRALGDRQGECETLTNMAFACLEQDKINLAENYSRLALQIKEDIGYERGIAFNYLINVKVARFTGDFKKAEEIIDKSLSLPVITSSNWLKLSFLLEDSLVCISKKDSEMAEFRFDEISTMIRQQASNIPKTLLVQFYHHYGSYLLNNGDEESGREYMQRSKMVLGELERKIFQMNWRKKFRDKYDTILSLKERENTPAAV
jgi:tetratricopeptide (TPR) repeat protein/serine/threonine protein kinase